MDNCWGWFTQANGMTIELGNNIFIGFSVWDARQKFINDHRIMYTSFKPRKNSVYSRLLGGRNDEDFWNDADGSAQRGRGSAQAEQWNAS